MTHRYVHQRGTAGTGTYPVLSFAAVLIMGIACGADGGHALAEIEFTVLASRTVPGMCTTAPTRVIDDSAALNAFCDSLAVDPAHLAHQPNFALEQVLGISCAQTAAAADHVIYRVVRTGDTTRVDIGFVSKTLEPGMHPQPGCKQILASVPRQATPITFRFMSLDSGTVPPHTFPFDTTVSIAQLDTFAIPIHRYAIELRYCTYRIDYEFHYYYGADLCAYRGDSAAQWSDLGKPVDLSSGETGLFFGMACGVVMPPDTCGGEFVSLTHDWMVYALTFQDDSLYLRITSIAFDTARAEALSMTLRFDTTGAAMPVTPPASPRRHTWKNTAGTPHYYDLQGRRCTPLRSRNAPGVFVVRQGTGRGRRLLHPAVDNRR